jgi:hypothetical protein
MIADGLIRAATAAAVLVVAAIAAVVSFVHIEHLAVTHGQAPLAAYLLPLSIDGTVAAASMVMLRAARAGLRTPWLARFMLGLAVAATLLANIGYGLPFGWAGALISGWPACAFIGCAEMAIGMVRHAKVASAAATATVTDPRLLASSAVPATAAWPSALDSAKAAYEASVRGGNPLSERALASRFGITRPQAKKVRTAAAQSANGHQRMSGTLSLIQE